MQRGPPVQHQHCRAACQAQQLPDQALKPPPAPAQSAMRWITQMLGPAHTEVWHFDISLQLLPQCSKPHSEQQSRTELSP